MNTTKFMFRDRNNLLPFYLQKLYSIKLHNTYLFNRFKVWTDKKALSIIGVAQLTKASDKQSVEREFKPRPNH